MIRNCEQFVNVGLSATGKRRKEERPNNKKKGNAEMPKLINKEMGLINKVNGAETSEQIQERK